MIAARRRRKVTRLEAASEKEGGPRKGPPHHPISKADRFRENIMISPIICERRAVSEAQLAHPAPTSGSSDLRKPNSLW